MAVAAPNFPVFNNAVNGFVAESNNMATAMQNYAQHQQTIGQQLQLIGNQPYGAAVQNLATAVQGLTAQITRLESKIDNMDIKFQNSKLHQANENLEVPSSLDPGPNAQVPVGTPIPNFPATPQALMLLNQLECRRILTALSVPYQNIDTVATLRLKIRKAIGLPAL